jgi:hypothetical protein
MTKFLKSWVKFEKIQAVKNLIKNMPFLTKNVYNFFLNFGQIIKYSGQFVVQQFCQFVFPKILIHKVNFFSELTRHTNNLQ